MNQVIHPAAGRSGAPLAADSLAIAHIHTGLVGSGGDSVSELEARYLAAAGHRVTIVGQSSPDIAARLAAHGIALIDDSTDNRSVEDIVARTGPLDVVHCHCFLSVPFAADLARAGGAVLVIHKHSMGESWWECTDLLSTVRAHRQRLRRSIDRAVASADRLLCVSQAVCDHMATIGLPTVHSTIIPNPIDDVFFREAAATGEPFDVAVLARPSRAKSPFITLRLLGEASRRRPGLRMIWMGALGRWEPILRAYARWLGLGNLTFTGHLPATQICDYLDRTRVLVSASNREGQPLSVLEALARQCSALLSDIPAHRPFATHKGVALFPVGDAAEGGRLLCDMLTSHRRQPRIALAGHRLEEHGQALLALYRQLVLDRRRRIGRTSVEPPQVSADRPFLERRVR